MHKKLLFSLISSFIFFIVSFLTLRDYGPSWDEAIHFRRGQAYLYYYLTGNTNYEILPKINLQGTNGDPKKIPVPRRSFYQNDYHNGVFWLKNDNDIGHPPLNDELAALSNYIFFQRLGILDDIPAHHLFNILASSLLVFVVVAFARSTFGAFAAVVAFLALATYPLFWAESHFNVKDPPEAAFFAATIWSFYNSLKKGSYRWLSVSIIFFTLGLGTKFNILFLPVIVVPYLLYRYRNKLLHLKKVYLTIPNLYIPILLVTPFVVLGILTLAWPSLRQEWPISLLKIFSFYRESGTGSHYQPDQFFLFGFNTYPVQWILFTTPPLVLALSGIGIFSAWLNRSLYKGVTLLWFLWFIIPIARVTMPGTVVYGGIRQVLEFLPALTLLAGLGAWQIFVWLRKSLIVKIGLVLAFLWPVIVLVKLHPNENVYFNSLVGGLPGAKERDFPSWGNSFGNAYFQGIKWINTNVEKDAKLALIQGTPANAPVILLREDIQYIYSDTTDKSYFSGDTKAGEYLMELTFNDSYKPDSEAWRYVEKYLIPIYEVQVEGIPILKIWKNDSEHTKK